MSFAWTRHAAAFRDTPFRRKERGLQSMSKHIRKRAVAVGAIVAAAMAGVIAGRFAARPIVLAGAETDYPLRVEIVPIAFDVEGRGGAPRLELHLASGFEEAAKVRWAQELVTDRGRAVSSARRSDIHTLDKKGANSKSALELPRDL